VGAQAREVAMVARAGAKPLLAGTAAAAVATAAEVRRAFHAAHSAVGRDWGTCQARMVAGMAAATPGAEREAATQAVAATGRGERVVAWAKARWAAARAAARAAAVMAVVPAAAMEAARAWAAAVARAASPELADTAAVEPTDTSAQRRDGSSRRLGRCSRRVSTCRCHRQS